MQMLVRFDGRGMVAVLPERPVAPFALVVLLSVRPAMSCML